MSDKPVEKTVSQKIAECKEVTIQGMEKTLQHKMVYLYLKDRKKEQDVKNFTVNSRDGVIKIEFNDHEKAYNFYREANFTDKILVRPFNIYFNLSLGEHEMKKYYLEGISDDNQRHLFDAVSKIGVCKIYTSYGSGVKAKLKPTGLLSFIRKEVIPQDQYKTLEDDLKKLGIKIYPYVHDKGMKVSLNLINFLSDDIFDTDDQAIQELAENEAKKIIKKFIPNPDIHHVSVITKKKET